MKRLIAVAAIAGIITSMMVPTVSALEQPGMTIGSEHRLDERDFPPIAANDPGPLLATVEDCKTSPTCDAIPVTIDVPPKYLYRLVISLSWLSPKADETSVTDMDMYLFDAHYRIQYDNTGKEKKDATGATVYDWDYEEAGSAASSANPEVAKVAGITATNPKHVFWIVVNNYAGPNSGYHIKMEMIVQSLPTRRSPTPRARPSFTVNTTKSPSPKPSPSPSPTLSPVKVPGADGPLGDYPLSLIKGESGPTKKASNTPIVVGTLALLGLGLGIGTFFFLRSRRRAPE